MVRLLDPATSNTYYAENDTPPPLNQYRDSEVMVLLRGGKSTSSQKAVQPDSLPVHVLVHAELCEKEAAKMMGFEDDDMLTFPAFLRAFYEEGGVDPSAKIVMKSYFRLLVAEQATELLSLPPEPEEALARLQALEETLVKELAERRRAQACMDAEADEADKAIAAAELEAEELRQQLQDPEVQWSQEQQRVTHAGSILMFPSEKEDQPEE